MQYVPGEGSSNAKLAVIGEAPGSEEERTGRPFVGVSGKMVDDLLLSAGCPRPSVYVSNVVKIRPPNNDIKQLHLVGHKIEDFIPQLKAELDALQPNAIIAFGNTALEALTGYKGIEKYRGSILPCTLSQGIKVIPTIHPAAILHGQAESKMKSWKDLTYIQWDVNRAVEQSKNKIYDPPRRNLLVCRNSLDLYRFMERYTTSKYVSVDIETFRTFPICIGLAFNSSEAMSVPLFNFSDTQHQGMTRSDVIQCWKMIAELLYNPELLKIGQNFKFDEKLLSTCLNGTTNFGLKVNGFYFDTMLGFRTLYPELSGKLEFIASVLTEEIYWKDEGKEYNPKKDKFDRLLLYNAKDAAVTFECFERELEELKETSQEDFFFTRVMPLHPFYSRIERRGILRDTVAKRFLEEKYKEKWKDLQEELDSLTKEYLDEPINVNSNGRNGDVPKLLFGLMNIPARAGTGEKELDALVRNVIKDEKKKRICRLILEIRKVRKTIGTYIDSEVDFRGRSLTGYRIMLETGRTSTSILKPPVTTVPMGLAFQTITKHGDVGTDLRRMFVPDKNHIFIEPDLNGAEARVVAILARDTKLLKMFEYGIDIHRVTEGWISNICPDNLLDEFFSAGKIRAEELTTIINKILKDLIDSEARQRGKKFRHAAAYDVGKRTAGENAGVSEWAAGRALDRVHATNPNIRQVFHKDIQEALQNNNRILISPHGRQRQFLNKWGNELFREAYADIPQATVSDQTKFAAQRIEKRAPWLQILQESHDSFLAQIPLAVGEQYPMRYLDCSIPIIKEELERPIDFRNCSLPRGELVIPCEISIGEKSWEEMTKII
jgi:uracil-DNA glycosylase